MNRLDINEDRCKACKLCVDVCPKHILALAEEKLNSKGFHPVELHRPEECTACAVCAIVCPETCFEVYREVKAKTA